MKRTVRNLLISIGVILIVLMASAGVTVWYLAFKPNVACSDNYALYVRPGDDFDDVVEHLEPQGVLSSLSSFHLFGSLVYFRDVRAVRPGYYELRPGMRNLDIARALAKGWQTPVRLVVNNMRLPEDFAGRVAKQLMLDSADVESFFNDTVAMRALGLTRENLFAMIVADTYEVWWDVSAKELMQRLVDERNNYWSRNNRTARAQALGLTPEEVATLASIVDSESNHRPELSTIAGLYINRLRKGMLLQSDPTVKFALRDFAKKRILNADLTVDSPYNTYRRPGLPPGPIRLPNSFTIEAVLDAPATPYIYMCADPSLNGTHRFARTAAEHSRNAQAYHKAISAIL